MSAKSSSNAPTGPVTPVTALHRRSGRRPMSRTQEAMVVGGAIGLAVLTQIVVILQLAP